MSFRVVHFQWLSDKTLESLIEIDEELLGLECWSSDSWYSFFRSGSSLVFLIFDEGSDVIGFLLCQIGPIGDEFHILKIVVKEEYQRRGFGRLMLDDLYKHFSGRVFLEVNVNNINALTFYEQNEFKVQRRIKKFYDNGDDAFFMLKEGKSYSKH